MINNTHCVKYQLKCTTTALPAVTIILIKLEDRNSSEHNLVSHKPTQPRYTNLNASLLRIYQLRVGRLKDQHDGDNGTLYADDDARDDDLRRRAHEPGLARDDLLLTSGEDARDAVRLGDERAVDEREGEAGQDARQVAREERRLRDERERRAVGDGDAE